MSDSASPIPNGAGHHEDDSGSHAEPTPDLSVNGDQSDADLFGDGDDGSEDQPVGAHRKLGDSELDSGDDLDRSDRVANTIEDDEEVPVETKKQTIELAEIARIIPPEGEDLYLLNMPPFLGLSQRAYNPTTFKVPTHPHGSEENEPPPPKFSAFNTATSTIRWRRDPKDKSKLQSNARIIRWSDGSLTLQLASSPKDQYRISSQALRQSFGKPKSFAQNQTDYDPSKDAQVYLAAYHDEGDLTEIVAPVSAALRILPTGEVADESVLKLQESLAANMNVHDPLAALKQVKEDPELARLQAEQFDKERMRSHRRREAAEDKLLTRRDRVLGRAGVNPRAGLSVAGLEGDDDAGMRGSSSRRAGNSAAKRRRTNRHGIIYSSDEDESHPRGRTREDEYDEDDGFLVGSDEEIETFDSGAGETPEEENEDPDVDDLEIEGHKTVVDSSTRGGERDRNKDRELLSPGAGKGVRAGDSRSRSRGGTPARPTDVDMAGGAVTQGSPSAGRKKRRVIDDDDDDE